jgi:hypothetical protein
MPLLQRNPEALWTEFDRQVVVLSISSGHYFETRGLGGEIWRLLETPRMQADVVRHVLQRYEVEPARGEQDVLAFLHCLEQAGLLAVVDPVSASTR